MVGATGLTGSLVVDLALQRGHDVVALTRDASRVSQRSPQLQIIEGSAHSPTDVARALRGVDAVIHCLGIGGKGDGGSTSLVSDSVAVVVNEMEKAGLQRLICMSNLGAGGSGPWFYRRLVLPIFLRWLKPIIADKDVMEALLRRSSLDWVSVRLPNIVAGPLTPVRVSEKGIGLGFSITAATVAHFLLSQAQDDAWLRRCPAVSGTRPGSTSPDSTTSQERKNT